MKKNVFYLLTVVCMFSVSTVSKAQSGWFYSFESSSSNYYTSIGTWLVNYLVNSSIASVADIEDGAPLPFEIGYEYFSIRDDGTKINTSYGSPYGFQARDLFSNIKAGFRLGWQGAESPIGLYAEVNYRFRQFRADMEVTGDRLKNRIHSFEPGVGVRISPLVLLLDEYDWCPIVELGTNYVNNFKYTGGYDCGNVELNNGWKYSYSLGFNCKNNNEGLITVVAGFELYDYNLYNQNFTPDGGYSYPYANVTTKQRRYYIRVSLNF